MTERSEHWERIHATKGPDEVSWFEPEATRSLSLIERVSPGRGASIVDVGAGASTLVDGLVRVGYDRITVLDISSSALDRTRKRLGDRAASVTWLQADVIAADLPEAAFDVWHDRAAFHFLTDHTDRARYIAQLRRTLRPHSHVIIATFAQDGPSRCSGLDIVQYSPETLAGALGSDFQLVTSTHEMHRTPWNAEQAFVYCAFSYEPR
jgi:ubiquinone/menaquinone biosynthesis C-methylase UbiE